MRNALLFALVAAVGVAGAVAQSGEFKTYESKKFGYSLKIPKEFEMEGKEDKTTQWMYQPGSTPAPAKEEKAEKGGKFKIGAKVKGLVGDAVGGAADAADSASGGGELEPAVMIYINWTWMPDVSSSTLFDANRDQVEKDIKSPAPSYTDLKVLNKENGYPNFSGGQGIYYKEVDKDTGDEIHRWHIGAYGNKSSYIVGMTGTYEQFEKWGPIYEEVVKSFKLIPMEE